MHHQQIIKLIKLVIQASVCAYLSMVAGVMMRRPRGVAVERVLPQRVPGRRQVQLQVAAVRHNLEAATTTSGAGVCHLCRCRRRVLLVCKCRTGMEPPLYNGHAVLCYKQEAAACAVDALCLDGTRAPFYSQPTCTAPGQNSCFLFSHLCGLVATWEKSPIYYEEILFHFY